MKTYEEFIQEPEQVPWWALGTWGRRFFGVFGKMLDDVTTAMVRATSARYVAFSPADALQHAVRDVDVPTFLAFDTEGELRSRVADPWTWHAKANTEPGYDDLFAILGLDPAETGILDSSNGPHWFTETWWSCFALVSRNPLGWGLRTETWDEFEARGLTWAQWDALGESWDYTAPASLFSQLREFMWSRKWAHAIPAYVVVSFGTGHTWDSLQASGLTWDEVEANFADWDALDDLDGILVLQTTRFWDAMNLEDENKPLSWDALEAMGVRWERMMTARNTP